jgi:hypothetical protein
VKILSGQYSSMYCDCDSQRTWPPKVLDSVFAAPLAKIVLTSGHVTGSQRGLLPSHVPSGRHRLLSGPFKTWPEIYKQTRSGLHFGSKHCSKNLVGNTFEQGL